MKFKKIIILLTTSLILLTIIYFILTKLILSSSLPKIQNKIWGKSFTIFMELPDPIKSSFMIFSGKRNFNNLFNDYNVKFLPDTQYIKLKFEKHKIGLDPKSRKTFYVENFKEDIILTSRGGIFYKTKLNELNNDNGKVRFEKIKVTNLNENNLGKVSILDSLVIGNQIFTSNVIKTKDCDKLEIKVAEISKILKFETFKLFKECALIGAGAGKLQPYLFNKKEGILISSTDSNNDVPGKKAQDDNSIFGKIFFLDLVSKDYEIISKGHRNPQGLFVKNDIILSTEHGPRGGDEINKILYKKNYGWPIASYGESYEKKDLIYKKSHKENNFEEPLYVFLPSIGISELIILPNTFDDMWKNNALVTSLNGRSIYRVKFEDDTFSKVLYTEKIYIGERIRDIKFIEKSNVILLSLERTGSLGILSKQR